MFAVQRLNKCLKQCDRPDKDQVHYTVGRLSGFPLTACGVRVSLPCFRDCQIFLLRGALLIEGQGRLVETCCSYLVKDEVWIELCGSETVIIIMEERQQRGACCKHTQEAQERILAEKSNSGTKCTLM